jgi:hypothetical protein
MRTLRRPLVACLVALLVAAGCTRTEDRQADNAGWDADQAIAEVTQRLASAGIAVYADPDDAQPRTAPAKPVSPMRLLESQVRAMALEATRHAGMSATDLDAHVPGVSAGSAELTPSQVIAGWAKYGDTPAAQYARDLLGDRVESPDKATFPQLVMVLFASDLGVAGTEIAEQPGSEPPPPSDAKPTTPAAPPPTSRPAPSSQPSPPTSQPSGTPPPAPNTNESPPGDVPAAAPVALTAASENRPCSAVVDFVDRVTATVFNAIGHLLELPQLTGGGFFSRLVNTIGKVLVGGANVVIDGAHFVVRNVGRVAIATVLKPVARIAGIVATIAQITSAVRPWTVVLSADPKTNRKAIGTEAPLRGSITARVDLGGLDEWPPFLTDCAQVAGVTLPPLKPAGNPVTWTLAGTTSGLFNAADKQATLDAKNGATATYHTTVEPKYRNATEQVGYLVATATIQRDDVTKLQEALTTLFRDGLASLLPPAGDIVAPLVLPFVQPTIAKAFEVLAHLRDAGNTTAVPISYHTGDEEEPEPGEPTSSTPPPAARGKMPDSCPTAETITAATGLAFEHQKQTKQAGALYCAYSHKWGEHADLDPDAVGVELIFHMNDANMTQQFIDTMEQNLGPCRSISVPDATTACISANGKGVAQGLAANDPVLARISLTPKTEAASGASRPSWNAQDLAKRVLLVAATHVRGLR